MQMTYKTTNCQNQVYFVNTEDCPLKTEHICYFTKGDGMEIELHEVVEEYFPHPDAPDDLMVQCIKVYCRDKQRLTNYKSGLLMQSSAMENTLRMMYPITHSDNEK
jgi:hypothetical protein